MTTVLPLPSRKERLALARFSNPAPAWFQEMGAMDSGRAARGRVNSKKTLSPAPSPSVSLMYATLTTLRAGGSSTQVTPNWVPGRLMLDDALGPVVLREKAMSLDLRAPLFRST